MAGKKFGKTYRHVCINGLPRWHESCKKFCGGWRAAGCTPRIASLSLLSPCRFLSIFYVSTLFDRVCVCVRDSLSLFLSLPTYLAIYLFVYLFLALCKHFFTVANTFSSKKRLRFLLGREKGSSNLAFIVDDDHDDYRIGLPHCERKYLRRYWEWKIKGMQEIVRIEKKKKRKKGKRKKERKKERSKMIYLSKNYWIILSRVSLGNCEVRKNEASKSSSVSSSSARRPFSNDNKINLKGCNDRTK